MEALPFGFRRLSRVLRLVLFVSHTKGGIRLVVAMTDILSSQHRYSKRSWLLACSLCHAIHGRSRWEAGEGRGTGALRISNGEGCLPSRCYWSRCLWVIVSSATFLEHPSDTVEDALRGGNGYSSKLGHCSACCGKCGGVFARPGDDFRLEHQPNAHMPFGPMLCRHEREGSFRRLERFETGKFDSGTPKTLRSFNLVPVKKLDIEFSGHTRRLKSMVRHLVMWWIMTYNLTGEIFVPVWIEGLLLCL